MKKAILAILALFLVAPAFAGAQIQTLDQWKSDGTNITQRTASKPLKLTGYTSLPCLGTNASGVVGAGQCGGAFPFTPSTNFAATTNATGTPVWFQSGLQASTTSQFDTGIFTVASVGTTTNRFGKAFGVTGGQVLDGGLVLTNGTSNLIDFGAIGVAVPTNGSVGERIRLFGAAGGAVTANDYALGIASGQMWFNRAAGAGSFAWYSGSVNNMTLNSTGLIISTSTASIASIAPVGTLDLYGQTMATSAASTEEEFTLERPLNSGVSFPQLFSLKLGRYQTGGGTFPKTAVDFCLKSAANATRACDTTVLSLDDNGNVGIGTTSPQTTHVIQGYTQSVIASGTATSTCTTAIEGAQVYNLGNHHLWLCQGSEPWTLLK